MKYSKQREEVKEAIKDRKDHPTAAKIYEEIRKTDKTISIATVYRNLNCLVEKNEIKRISLKEEDHFDPNIDEHQHFVCDNCGKIYDIDSTNKFESIDRLFESTYGGKVKSHEFIMHGLCKDCL